MGYSEELEILAARILVLMNQKRGLSFDRALNMEFPDSELSGYSYGVVKSGVSKFHKKWRRESQERKQGIRLAGARLAAWQAREHITPLH